MKRCLILGFVLGHFFSSPCSRGADPAANDQINDDYWVETMAKVHGHFSGEPGTFAHFGDSITVSMAFWAPLAGEPNQLSDEGRAALQRVKAYMREKCWQQWKGPEYGSEGGMTIRWAHENIDDWLQRLNPEVALIMYGTNDLGQLDQEEYEQKTRDVVRRCLDNGTIVILNTIPPFSGRLDQSRQFAETVAKIAREENVPLLDYFGEVLRRRPDDWDGTLAKFKTLPGDEYQVPTLISRDGVHPSYPSKFANDFSESGLNVNGYNLRSYLVLLTYDRVINRVLLRDKEEERPPNTSPRGAARANPQRPKHFPHRIWAACDFEGQTRDYAWFGPTEKQNIPQYPGNATALGVSARPYENFSAVMTGINPVPGPRMGKQNQLFLRYYLRGGDEATFQHFSLSSEDNQHIRVSGLRQEAWSELTLDFSRDAARNDGSSGAFGDGERMDDFKIFAGLPAEADRYELIIDDVVFFSNNPELPPEQEPFPRRVIFLASFDTGPQEEYWPGDFALVDKDLPADTYWRAARAVPRTNGSSSKWIRLQIAPPRPVGAHTKLRVRYWQSGVEKMTVQIFDATDQDNRHVVLERPVPERWTNVYVDLAHDGQRNDGSDTPFAAGHIVDDLFFFVEGEDAELFIDEAVLYDAGEN